MFENEEDEELDLWQASQDLRFDASYLTTQIQAALPQSQIQDNLGHCDCLFAAVAAAFSFNPYHLENARIFRLLAVAGLSRPENQTLFTLS